MKYSGVCPKCGKSNIIRIEGQAKAYGAGNNIPVGLTIFSYVKVHRYLCLECGFSEEWIDHKDLPELERRYR